MQKLDCLGEICPIPVLRLKESLPDIMKGNELLLVTDHSCTLTSVKDFCKNHHLQMKSEEVINGVWEITVSR